MTDGELIFAQVNRKLVAVENHDYKFYGHIVATFNKGNGQMRCVVEDGRGLLLIQSAKNLELYDD